jgi:glycosyltransferase involved in cell wall biosynthesis
MSEIHWAFIHPFQLRLQRGIEVYLWNLSVALASAGIQVDILTWDGPLAVPQYAQTPGITIYKVPTVRYFQAAFAIPFYIYWLLKSRYQQVFVHFAGYGEGLAIDFAKIFCRINFSVIFHFPYSQVPLRYKEFKQWHFDQNASHLIAVSNATAREAEKWSGCQIDVIGHGVNSQYFSPDLDLRAGTREQLGIPEKAFVLITVAALEERKGIQWVILALKENPSVYYLVVGDGPYINELAQLTASLHLQNRVLLLGFQREVKPYLAASDLAFLLAYGEAFGIVLLEYAAMQLPIVTSKHEPFPEIIKDSWGYRVDEKDTHAVSALISSLSDFTKRERMGKAAREWVIREHNWDEIAKQYIELIDKQ